MQTSAENLMSNEFFVHKKIPLIKKNNEYLDKFLAPKQSSLIRTNLVPDPQPGTTPYKPLPISTASVDSYQILEKTLQPRNHQSRGKRLSSVKRNLAEQDQVSNRSSTLDPDPQTRLARDVQHRAHESTFNEAATGLMMVTTSDRDRYEDGYNQSGMHTERSSDFTLGDVYHQSSDREHSSMRKRNTSQIKTVYSVKKNRGKSMLDKHKDQAFYIKNSQETLDSQISAEARQSWQ